jgi:hypothetical protein
MNLVSGCSAVNWSWRIMFNAEGAYPGWRKIVIENMEKDIVLYVP